MARGQATRASRAASHIDSRRGLLQLRGVLRGLAVAGEDLRDPALHPAPAREPPGRPEDGAGSLDRELRRELAVLDLELHALRVLAVDEAPALAALRHLDHDALAGRALAGVLAAALRRGGER